MDKPPRPPEDRDSILPGAPEELRTLPRAMGGVIPLDALVNRDQVLRDLAQVVNRHSLENGSNTPDFLLAEVMLDALQAFNRGVSARESWHARNCAVGIADFGGDEAGIPSTRRG